MKEFLKRAFDLILSFAFLLLALPFTLAIALAIKVDTPGPVLFRGVRVGRNGIEFEILKFRTMVDRPSLVGLAITGGKDPRITHIGQFLRNYKLDEIPQLMNVIRGEMSLVGPRPEDPIFVSTYTEKQRAVLTVRPGIASPAAIKFRHEESFLADVLPYKIDQVYLEEILPEKLSLDLEYIDNNSILTDIKIMIQAVLASLRS